MTVQSRLLKRVEKDLEQATYSPSFFKGVPVDELTHEELLKAYHLLAQQFAERLETWTKS